MSQRDTQFAGYAHVLWEELAARINALDDECNLTEEVVDGCVMCNLKPERIAVVLEQVIAQRAYDLMQHVVGYSLEYLDECGHELSGGMGKRIGASISDLTTWPEE
jgi:hypothetical protein